MSPTMKDLWEKTLSRTRPAVSSETREKCRAYGDKIQDTFGLDFWDEFTQAYDAEQWEELESAYELGFLTAFHLWMEVLAHNPPG